MSVIPIRLFKGSVGSGTPLTRYTVPAGMSVVMTHVIVTNTNTTSARTINFQVSINGGTNTVLMSDLSILPNQTITLDTPVNLGANGRLVWSANSSGLTIYVSGVLSDT